MKHLLCPLAILATLAGCAGRDRSVATAQAAEPGDWRRIATNADRDRLRRWRDAWMAALPRARAADPRGVAAQGALFEPDQSLPGAPPPGPYHCRVFKLGGAGTAAKDFTAYPTFDCRIDDEGQVRSFYKLTGSQRPVGLVFPADGRSIFLGTLLLGNERSALQYGQDADRDLIGVIDRVGERRWRMMLPYPRFESMLDVIELVPA